MNSCSVILTVRKFARLGFVLCLVLVSAIAGAQPDAAQVQRAAEAFDQGSRAFQAGRYELAASQFEAADAAVPSARAIRMAIRARSQAGHDARAATLAIYAKQRYPDDEATVSLADETLEPLAAKLHKLEVTCSSACLLAVGTRVVPGKPTTERVVFVQPGTVTVSASFVKDNKSAKQQITATAGGSDSLFLEPATAPPPPVDPPPVPTSTAAATATACATGAPVTPPEEEESSGWSPAVFATFLVATVGMGAVTIWSGVDTINDPGKDAVREQCAGLGTECPLYQDGRAKQTRTNVLIGVTAGVGALAVVIGAFLTDWGGGEGEASESADGGNGTAASRVRLVPSPGGAGVAWRF